MIVSQQAASVGPPPLLHKTHADSSYNVGQDGAREAYDEYDDDAMLRILVSQRVPIMVSWQTCGLWCTGR